MGTLIRIATIILVSTAIAAGFNAGRTDGKGISWITNVNERTEEGKAIQQAKAEPGATLDELIDAAQNCAAVVIDSRDPEAFQKGHLAIDASCYPGIINLHDANVHEVAPLALDYLFGRQIILYCTSETCDLAERVAYALEGYGISRQNMSVFRPGWEGIQQAKLATAQGQCYFLLEIGAAGADPYADPGMQDDYYDEGMNDEDITDEATEPDFSGLPEPGDG